MKIYDCFIYFDEEILLNIRLNILNKFVDKFIIVESLFSHSGEARKPNFNIKNFERFKDKIIYILTFGNIAYYCDEGYMNEECYCFGKDICCWYKGCYCCVCNCVFKV